MANAAPFPSRFKRSGRARPMPKSNSVRAHPKAALRPAVAAAVGESSATADLQVPNRKQRRASLSASTGDQNLPRAVRRPHTHRSRADHPAGNARAHTRHSQPSATVSIGSCRGRPDSSAPAPPIETVAEALPSRTRGNDYHMANAATPLPADSIGSRRTVPIAARRRRRSNPLAEAPPSRARAIDYHKVNAEPFPSKFQRSGRARPMPKSNSVRAHPKAALRPAVASGCWRRTPLPPISKSQTENSGEPRCRPAPATRNCRAPFGAHTQPEMPERTHASAPSSASGFDRLAPNRPHSCAPEPPIETAG